MINDDTRQTIRFIIWTIIVLVILYIASIFIFYQAGSPSRQNQQNIAAVATKKTPITHIDTYYHLDRGTDSYAIKGNDKKGQKYYFIYLPNSKKAYLYTQDKGTSQASITKTFKETNSNATIKQVNLGWYQGKPVWEVSYQKNHNLGFNLYDFKTGKAINEVDNL